MSDRSLTLLELHFDAVEVGPNSIGGKSVPDLPFGPDDATGNDADDTDEEADGSGRLSVGTVVKVLGVGVLLAVVGGLVVLARQYLLGSSPDLDDVSSGGDDELTLESVDDG